MSLLLLLRTNVGGVTAVYGAPRFAVTLEDRTTRIGAASPADTLTRIGAASPGSAARRIGKPSV